MHTYDESAPTVTMYCREDPESEQDMGRHAWEVVELETKYVAQN